LKQKGKGVIVCGDFNVSLEEIDIHVTPNTHKQPGFTAEERTSFKSFLNKGWIDTFRKLHPTQRAYTWWRIEHNNREKNIGKRLDYFLVNTDFFKYVKKAEVLGEVMGSDHCPIFLELNFS
jgi:exodeoxyribonuclease-3